MSCFVKLLMFPSCSGRGYGYLGGRHRDRVPFYYTVKRLDTINMASILMSALITWLKKCLSDLPSVKLFPLSSILYSGRISLCVVYKVNKNYSLCLWRLFEILLFWRFVYSIIYLYNHRVMDIYFILLFIIQTYLFILLFTCFSFGHWELFHLFLYPFNICHLCVCLSTYFSFKHFLLLQDAPCSSSILSPHSA